jgi:hypothetical protein
MVAGGKGVKRKQKTKYIGPVEILRYSNTTAELLSLSLHSHHADYSSLKKDNVTTFVALDLLHQTVSLTDMMIVIAPLKIVANC